MYNSRPQVFPGSHCSMQSQIPSRTSFQNIPWIFQWHSLLKQHCTGGVQTRRLLHQSQKGHILLTKLLYQDRRATSWPSFSLINGEEILSAYQYEQQPSEWSCLQSYKAYSTEIFKNLTFKSADCFEEGHKNKWLIHNQGLTWGDVLLYISVCCKFASNILLSFALCPETGTLGMIELI